MLAMSRIVESEEASIHHNLSCAVIVPGSGEGVSWIGFEDDKEPVFDSRSRGLV